MMSDELFQLAIWFIRDVKRMKGYDARTIEAQVKEAQSLLEAGNSARTIREAVERFRKEKRRAPIKMGEAFGEKQEENLIESEGFYYHRMLRNIPSPPKLVWNEWENRFMRIAEGFYLEMRDSFTMNDLLGYFWTKSRTSPSERERKEDEGKFRYLLQHYTVDELLFSIDAAEMARAEEQKSPLKNVFELKEYMEEAKFLLQQKANIHRKEGIDSPIGKGPSDE